MPNDHGPCWTASLVGSSAAARELRALVARYARFDGPVLASGETGVGKELVARILHDVGTRARGPFKCVNCGAIPDALFESELFGHARGSFTGATDARPGAFDSAKGGTLFLDEIGELPPVCQVKLLRVLDQRTYQRVGSTEERSTDSRIVCATNRNLEAMVEAGTFRRDLYHRLAVLPIRVPPLRERGGDIPELLDSFAPLLPRPFRCSPEAMAELMSRPWLGNVRELRNFAEHAVCTSDSGVFELDELRSLARLRAASPAPARGVETATNGRGSDPRGASLDLWLKREGEDHRLIRINLAAVEHAVALENGNKSAAARRLGVSRGKLLRTLALKTKLNGAT